MLREGVSSSLRVSRLCSGFRELLHQLDVEHAREISMLAAEIERLQFSQASGEIVQTHLEGRAKSVDLDEPEDADLGGRESCNQDQDETVDVQDEEGDEEKEETFTVQPRGSDWKDLSNGENYVLLPTWIRLEGIMPVINNSHQHAGMVGSLTSSLDDALSEPGFVGPADAYPKKVWPLLEDRFHCRTERCGKALLGFHCNVMFDLRYHLDSHAGLPRVHVVSVGDRHWLVRALFLDLRYSCNILHGLLQT